MKVIYKYKLDTIDTQIIKMPFKAKVLSVQVQKGEVCLWALVDTPKKMEDRCFKIYGTGNLIHNDVSFEKFIGTYQLDGGDFVYHVFAL